MGKGHRDNHRARKKRGSIAFTKKSKRRHSRDFTGSWEIEFECGKFEYVPWASSSDIRDVSIKKHSLCTCQPIRYVKQK
uniref:Uncharacterized protein n=1 Tax=viral metagenome TaxID=1070528 RepID=A0A6M3L3V2_9ZZZZ